MGRWTQFSEDSTRLPEGVKRIGYDADTGRYTFCDGEGNIYLGPPHEEYGSLTLVGKSARPPSSTNDRPQAFASGKANPALSVQIQPPGSGQTFHDFVPAHLITSPSSAESSLSDSPTGEASARSRFRDAVRRTTLPAMQNVVNNIRRSTTVRKPKDSEKKGLLRSGSQASSKLTRSNTSTTTSTFQSNEHN
ncbi:hypothetical protein B0H17DRAFT_167887 [Mycena rosella]|uniref:Uncharacterized protein n=1 Tax=Mycena rosella TaxID=1033263 RepID=A0AAD7GR50_MYCRO|nr:hypothetical protein B0H17DRAFT_167887 [Mycena rosella]